MHLSSLNILTLPAFTWNVLASCRRYGEKAICVCLIWAFSETVGFCRCMNVQAAAHECIG